MTNAEMLSALKFDLGILSADAYDTRLEQYIDAAKTQIEREGITLSFDSIDDCQIVIAYAAWMWRKRDTGEAMPRMIRYWMNNRVFAEKAGGNNA